MPQEIDEMSLTKKDVISSQQARTRDERNVEAIVEAI